MQSVLTDWENVQSFAALNNKRRVDYASIFRHSLTSEITIIRNNNPCISSDDCFLLIKDALFKKGVIDVDVLRRVNISIKSRFVEQDAYIKRCKA